jgi:hypothetical protein
LPPIAATAILLILILAEALLPIVSLAELVSVTAVLCHAGELRESADEVAGVARIATDELARLPISRHKPFVASDLGRTALISNAKALAHAAALARAKHAAAGAAHRRA